MTTEAETQWRSSMCAMDAARQTLERTLAWARASKTWAHREHQLQAASKAIRELSDALSEAEKLVTSQLPPICNLRIRDEPIAGRRKPGMLNGMVADPNEPRWLVLASDNTQVLEIEKGPEEWCHEADERFKRACKESPAEVLARGLPAAEPDDFDAYEELARDEASARAADDAGEVEDRS